MDYSPPDSSVHGDSPGKNTGVGCLALLQGIIPTQQSNPGLPHSRQILCGLSKPPGKPKSTGVSSLSLLQENFSTQELNWDLLHYRQILYQLSQQRSLISTLPRGNKKTQRTHHCAVPQVPTDISSKQSIFFLHFRDIPSWIILLCLGLFSYKIEGLQGMGWLHLGRKRRPWGEIFMWNIFTVRWLHVPHSSIDECLGSGCFTKHLAKMWDQWNPTESRRDVFSPQLLQQAKWGSTHYWWLWPKEFISKVALDIQHGTSGPQAKLVGRK